MQRRAINLDSYLLDIAPLLVPPVSNKLLFGSGQLKVMIVGGPNNRKVRQIMIEAF